MIKKKQAVTATLLIVAVIAIGLGVWFSLSPTVEKQEALSQQQALLDSIQSGDGVVEVDDTTAQTVDFYDKETAEDSTAYVPPTESTPEAPAIHAPAKLIVTGTGILTIDRLNMKLPVTDGVTEEQLKIAIGHVPETAPIGSEGNAVLAGHRSYTYGQFFNRLGEAEPGDIIRYEDKSGAVFAFEVYQLLEIEPEDQMAFVQPKGEYILTLYTCTPIRTATHRLLVRARLVTENSETIEMEESR